MSNETKRDVLVDAVDALADAQASSGDANLFMAEYDAALPDETDKQKNCPYCHETDPKSKHAHYGRTIALKVVTLRNKK